MRSPLAGRARWRILAVIAPCGCGSVSALDVGSNPAPGSHSGVVLDATAAAEDAAGLTVDATEESPRAVGDGPLRPEDSRGDGTDDSAGTGTFVYWASWQGGDAGLALGTITLPISTIGVTYTGQLSGLQTDTGTDYFVPVATFTSPTVPDAPPGPAVIEVAGTSATPDTVTFSEPVTNPVVAIYNLGVAYAQQPASMQFSAPFVVLSSGPNASGTGYWGNGQLAVVDGGVSGVGSNGVVELEGTFSFIQFTNPSDIPFASFTGLTVGVRAAP